MSTSTRWGATILRCRAALQLESFAPCATPLLGKSTWPKFLSGVFCSYSNGTPSWTTIQSVINGDGGVDDFTGLSGSGRYLRVYGTRRGTTYGYSIYEINAYGAAATTTPAPATPTLIQAESYSSMSGVGLETTSDTGGGQDVGWIDTGDSMTYNGVVFPSTGTYTLEYRVASPGGGSLAASLNGTALGGTQAIAATGGWQSWKTITQTVSVPAGTYNLNLKVVAGGWNIDWLRITPPATSSAARAAASASAIGRAGGAKSVPELYGRPAAAALGAQPGWQPLPVRECPGPGSGQRYRRCGQPRRVRLAGGHVHAATHRRLDGQRMVRHFVKLQ